MANTIYLNNKDSMSMSNGCTDVFLTTIGLSGSRLAVTDGEKRLILWLLEWGRKKNGWRPQRMRHGGRGGMHSVPGMVSF